MKKILALIAVLFVASCGGTTSTGMPQGAIYTGLKDNAYHNQVDNSVKVTKTGTACAENILGAVAFGDSSLAAAKKDGKIRNVAHYDRDYKNILGIYIKGCTVAYGN